MTSTPSGKSGAPLPEPVPGVCAHGAMGGRRTPEHKRTFVGLLLGAIMGLGLAAAVTTWVQHQPPAKRENSVQNTGQPVIPQDPPRNPRAQTILPDAPETKHSFHDDGYPQTGRRGSDQYLRFNAPGSGPWAVDKVHPAGQSGQGEHGPCDMFFSQGCTHQHTRDRFFAGEYTFKYEPQRSY